jgi:predicted enzyme related to lactoylglutathione lyase
MKRVSEIGGFFFKAADRERLKAWYAQMLGLRGEYGVVFQWHDPLDPKRFGHTVLGFFKNDSTYFAPSEKPFMVNYRVSNLVHLQTELAAEGLHPVGTNEVYEFGKFGWTLDPEFNKLEFWQPKDDLYQQFFKPLPFIDGIGGVFFEANDADKLQDWYARYLHLESDEYGIQFEWLRPENDRPVWLEWAVYPSVEARKIFKPSEKPYMINFVVKDLDRLLHHLKQHGVTTLSRVEEYTYGRFTWILDPEGNKIELWQP